LFPVRVRSPGHSIGQAPNNTLVWLAAVVLALRQGRRELGVVMLDL
jgi:hypothetical protein